MVRMSQPQHRLRIGEGRVFCDVVEGNVEAPAVVAKSLIITRHGQPAGVLIGCAAQGGLVRLPAGGDRSRVRWSPEGARLELKAGPGGFSFEDLVKHCAPPKTCAD